MRTILPPAVTAALLVSLTVPSLAHATSYEDSLQDCAYPLILDIAVMRPMAMIALGLGFALFSVVAPWTILVAPGELDEVANALIGRPTVFIFNRPLGACGTGQKYHN